MLVHPRKRRDGPHSASVIIKPGLVKAGGWAVTDERPDNQDRIRPCPYSEHKFGPEIYLRIIE